MLPCLITWCYQNTFERRITVPLSKGQDKASAPTGVLRRMSGCTKRHQRWNLITWHLVCNCSKALCCRMSCMWDRLHQLHIKPNQLQMKVRFYDRRDGPHKSCMSLGVIHQRHIHTDTSQIVVPHQVRCERGWSRALSQISRLLMLLSF